MDIDMLLDFCIHAAEKYGFSGFRAKSGVVFSAPNYNYDEKVQEKY